MKDTSNDDAFEYGVEVGQIQGVDLLASTLINRLYNNDDKMMLSNNEMIRLINHVKSEIKKGTIK